MCCFGCRLVVLARGRFTNRPTVHGVQATVVRVARPGPGHRRWIMEAVCRRLPTTSHQPTDRPTNQRINMDELAANLMLAQTTESLGFIMIWCPHMLDTRTNQPSNQRHKQTLQSTNNKSTDQPINQSTWTGEFDVGGTVGKPGQFDLIWCRPIFPSIVLSNFCSFECAKTQGSKNPLFKPQVL